MKHAPAAAPLRRLAPLAGVVLAMHVWLLQPEPHRTVPTPSMPFHTRTIASPAPPVMAAEPEPMPAPRPAVPPPVPRTRPAAQQPLVEAVRPPIVAVADARTEPAAAATQAPRVAPPAPTPAAVVALLPPTRLHYEVEAQVRGLTLSGHAQLSWRHDGQAYEAHMEATALGRPRVQRSVGRVTPQGLVPDYFSDKSRGERATHFDHEKNRLVFSNNRPDAPLSAGMQDRLSVLLQLAALVAGRPDRHVQGTTITIPTASTGDAEDWVFSVEGEEDLRLPGGPVRVLKVQRLPRKEYDQKVELWLAPRMDYAPVRLRLTNPNGDTVDQRWSSTDRG